jgi:hypothetical protein
VSSAAFTPNKGDSHLSVNSTEIESLKDIAVSYRDTFKNGMGPVAIACRKISDYNSAAGNAGIRISFCKVECKWKYNASEGIKDAYKHRPTLKSHSHCGVEYLGNDTKYLTIRKIARRLSGNRPHLFKIT